MPVISLPPNSAPTLVTPSGMVITPSILPRYVKISVPLFFSTKLSFTLSTQPSAQVKLVMVVTPLNASSPMLASVDGRETLVTADMA